ncbi:glycosyltransferase family 4 protein [Gammaproteobacteria bacterium]|nr:glycosyltransferase family 4 protein [Gammaproteobacteria bacterium]
MKVLVIAPHPYYEERGTPIDVLLLLRVLCARSDLDVHLLTYAEGETPDLDGLTIYRVAPTPLTHAIRPGFSLKKLVASTQVFFRALYLQRKHRFDLVHAGEEAVFSAMIIKRFWGVPYAYDLDSSIAQQMVEKLPWAKPLASLFNRLEAWAIRNALINFPVCNALGLLCEERHSLKTVVVHDISQLANPGAPAKGLLRDELGIDRRFIVYIGNLEVYQGIDLLLESFALAVERLPEHDLVVIGGRAKDIAFYQKKAEQLGIAERTHLVGPRPFSRLDEYLAEADILACPRIRGFNTPMKIFPYLHSGRPVLATDIHTHNQILSDEQAMLAPPTAEGFAGGMIRLANEPELAARISQGGVAMIETNHTFAAYQARLNKAYDWIVEQLA